MLRFSAPWYPILAAILTAAACAGEPADTNPAVERVANADIGAAPLRVSAAPLAVIGGVEEEGSPHLLGRVSSAGRLRDGRIVLVEATSREIRLFSSAGEHVWSLGREGDGPGEFRQPRFVGQASDDSLLIWDDGRARITELTPGGEVSDVRQVGTLVDRIAPRPRAVLSNDRLLGSFPGEGAPEEFSHGEIVHDFSRMYLTDLDYTDRTYVTEMTGATFQVFLDPDPAFVALPFTASANFAASGDRVLAVARDTRGVSMFSGDGTLVREMWVDRPRRPVTDQDWEAELQRRLADTPEDQRANEERRLNRLDIPDVMPVYDRVLDDGAGRIWARHYLPDVSVAPTWDLFSRDGRFAGAIESPPRLEIVQVGPDWILGIHLDDFMVPSVRMHVLESVVMSEAGGTR